MCLVCHPKRKISIEINKEANRVTRCTWPDTMELQDVTKITKEDVKEWANLFNRVLEVHVYAGFPCIHLSSVRAYRQNPKNRDQTFFWVLLDLCSGFMRSLELLVRSSIASRMLPRWTVMPGRRFQENWTPHCGET